MYLVGDSLDQGCQERGRRHAIGFCDELHEGEFARAVNGDIEMQLALGGLHLGDVDVEIADRIGLELLLAGLVSRHIRQARNAMALKAAVQA